MLIDEYKLIESAVDSYWTVYNDGHTAARIYCIHCIAYELSDGLPFYAKTIEVNDKAIKFYNENEIEILLRVEDIKNESK